MRRFSFGSVLFLWAFGALAQQPSAVPAEQSAPVIQPATDEPEDRIPKDDINAPPTPLADRDKEIRQFDPLDQDDDQAAQQKAKDKETRKAQQQDKDQTALPGSVAAETQDAANAGPQVVGDEDSDSQTPYTGPAVLSHSYTLNSDLIPQKLQWTESFSLANVYDSGMNAASVGPVGAVQNASGFGVNAAWGIAGRQRFHRDTFGIAYSGSRSWYNLGNQFDNLNTRLALDYTHVVSRRLSVKFTGTGSVLSQSYNLQNPLAGPEAPGANLNIATTPTLQIFDNGFKTYSAGVVATWQKSVRLSFTASVNAFETLYDNAALINVAGEQAQGTVNYRFTSKTTAGIFYSYSDYVFPHGQGITDSQSIGGLYSYAFSRSTRLQLRAGGGITETHAFEAVPLNPLVAELTGLQSEIVNGYFRGLTEDISASFTKDLGNRDTVTLSYTRGISPGNGIFLAGQSETMALTTTMKVHGRYPVMVSIGRTSLSSAALSSAAVSPGNYVMEYARVNSSRPINRHMMLTFGATYTYYQIGEFPGLRNEIALNSGVTWSRTEPKLW